MGPDGRDLDGPDSADAAGERNRLVYGKRLPVAALKRTKRLPELSSVYLDPAVAEKDEGRLLVQKEPYTLSLSVPSLCHVLWQFD